MLSTSPSKRAAVDKPVPAPKRRKKDPVSEIVKTQAAMDVTTREYDQVQRLLLSASKRVCTEWTQDHSVESLARALSVEFRTELSRKKLTRDLGIIAKFAQPVFYRGRHLSSSVVDLAVTCLSQSGRVLAFITVKSKNSLTKNDANGAMIAAKQRQAQMNLADFETPPVFVINFIKKGTNMYRVQVDGCEMGSLKPDLPQADDDEEEEQKHEALNSNDVLMEREQDAVLCAHDAVYALVERSCQNLAVEWDVTYSNARLASALCIEIAMQIEDRPELKHLSVFPKFNTAVEYKGIDLHTTEDVDIAIVHSQSSRVLALIDLKSKKTLTDADASGGRAVAELIKISRSLPLKHAPPALVVNITGGKFNIFRSQLDGGTGGTLAFGAGDFL